MSEAFLTAEQLDHIAQNLFRHCTDNARDDWDTLADEEKQDWRDRALAKFGDYASMSRPDRQRENLAALAISLASSRDPAPRREDAAGERSEFDATNRKYATPIVQLTQDGYTALQAALSTAEREREAADDALDYAWAILANVSGGDWTLQTADWQAAAAKWRDQVMPGLSSRNAARARVPSGGET